MTKAQGVERWGFTLAAEQNEFQQDRLRRGIRKNFLRMRKEFDLGRNDEENVNGFPVAFQIGHMSIKSYDLGVTVPGCVCVRVRGKNEVIIKVLSSSRSRDCTLQGEESERVGLHQENCGSGQSGSLGSCEMGTSSARSQVTEAKSHFLRPSSSAPNSILC